jgi:uncharacterized membrane protein YeaQ/YmgE (transglycosylase-associated protein family)
MGIVIWLIVGGVVGWLASIVMKTNAQMGIVANVLVGVVGAAVGSWLATSLGLGGGVLVTFVLAVVGASVLIAVLKALKIFK